LGFGLFGFPLHERLIDENGDHTLLDRMAPFRDRHSEKYKVRYYGLFSLGLRDRLASLREQLDGLQPNQPAVDEESQAIDQPTDHRLCPACGQIMQRKKTIPAYEYKLHISLAPSA
jgi:hypothetical protein